LAAEGEGLSTCPVRGFDQEELSETLDLDDHWLPLLLVPIGYSDEDHDRKYRRDLSEMTGRI
jgi:nitroreductase